jgi:type VI secretion system protein ImpA
LIKEATSECRSLMNTIVRKKGGVGTPTMSQPDTAPGEADMAPVVPTTASESGMMPVDRADALRRLGAVAEFFHRTEPPSPVAYLVQRAARWGEMPLEEWLQEVIKSDDVLGKVRETLGLTQGRPAQDKHS